MTEEMAIIFKKAEPLRIVERDCLGDESRNSVQKSIFINNKKKIPHLVKNTAGSKLGNIKQWLSDLLILAYGCGMQILTVVLYKENKMNDTSKRLSNFSGRFYVCISEVLPKSSLWIITFILKTIVQKLPCAGHHEKPLGYSK